MTISRAADGTWTITSVSAVKTVTVSFKLGEEFDYETPDGRKVKVGEYFESLTSSFLVQSTVTIVDGKMITAETATKPDEKSSTVSRQIKGNEMHCVSFLLRIEIILAVLQGGRRGVRPRLRARQVKRENEARNPTSTPKQSSIVKPEHFCRFRTVKSILQFDCGIQQHEISVLFEHGIVGDVCS